MSRVFVSCGQATDGERLVAAEICAKLRDRGFKPYLAIAAQTILEINAGIIRELRSSDHYVLVNFCRELLPPRPSGDSRHRGSLFSNQELAIAYALGFEHLLVINQEGVNDEGMLRYIGVNTERFRDYSDCVAVVTRAVDRSGWSPSYSRLLHADGLRFQPDIRYGNLVGTFMYVDIHNRRPDIAALEATGRLRKLGNHGELRYCEVRSPLKATGRPGYAHTIFPNSHEAFDLLCISAIPPHPPRPSANMIGVGSSTSSIAASGSSNPYFERRDFASSRPPNLNPSQQFAPARDRSLDSSASISVFLNSALDVIPISPIFEGYGEWLLQYEFFAIDFPVLKVDIVLRLESTKSPVAKIVHQTSGQFD